VSQDGLNWVKLTEEKALDLDIIPHLQGLLDDDEKEFLAATKGWAENQSSKLTEKRSRLFKSRNTEKRAPLQNILLIILLMVSVICLPLLVPSQDEVTAASCDQPAVPAVNWSNCLFPLIELKGVNMHRARLRSTNLHGSTISEVDLIDADLAYIDLGFAKLHRVALQSSDLRGADLSYSTATEVNFDGADLTYANLTGATWSQVSLEGANLSDTLWFDGEPCVRGSIGKCMRHQAKP
jgi:uncharacterized protein YjbI with pentapeptide repeats